eukprot:s10692_g2.t1
MAAKECPPPPGIAELGDDVWRGDKPSAQRGIVVLGTPEKRRLLDELPHLPDLQCAWRAVLRRDPRRTYPELCSGGPQEPVVLGSQVGGRWNGEAGRFVQHLLRVRSQRAQPALRHPAAAGWSRRWWGILAVAVQQAVASTALGQAWPAPLRPCQRDEPPLERVLELAGPATSPSRRSAMRCADNVAKACESVA